VDAPSRNAAEGHRIQGAAGVVPIKKKSLLINTTPSARQRLLRGIFLTAQPPLLI